MDRNATWMMLTGIMQDSANALTRMCQPWAADLILSETHRFCSQQPPEDDEEVQVRHRQANALMCVTHAISSADTSTRYCPDATNRIIEATQKVCGHPWPVTLEDSMEFFRRSMLWNLELHTICTEHSQ